MAGLLQHLVPPSEFKRRLKHRQGNVKTPQKNSPQKNANCSRWRRSAQRCKSCSRLETDGTGAKMALPQMLHHQHLRTNNHLTVRQRMFRLRRARQRRTTRQRFPKLPIAKIPGDVPNLWTLRFKSHGLKQQNQANPAKSQPHALQLPGACGALAWERQLHLHVCDRHPLGLLCDHHPLGPL